jgi:hypothetical protein
MHTIYLISTSHQPSGNYNLFSFSDILYQLKPDVSFEEIPPSHFPRTDKMTIEEMAIKKYSSFNKIERVPVDSDDLPSESFFERHKRMSDQIEMLDTIDGKLYRDCIDKHAMLVESMGLQYLNSSDCIEIQNQISNAILNGVKSINSDEYLEIFNLWNDLHSSRELVMLKNIYQYCYSHQFNKAIFTLGAAHRKSIIDKILEFSKRERVELDWRF